MMDEDYDDDQYDYCPSCGEVWDKHTKGILLDNGNYDMVCNPLTIIMGKKPRFYVLDIDNYNDEFLKKIISWQSEYIEYLEGVKK